MNVIRVKVACWNQVFYFYYGGFSSHSHHRAEIAGGTFEDEVAHSIALPCLNNSKVSF